MSGPAGVCRFGCQCQTAACGGGSEAVSLAGAAAEFCERTCCDDWIIPRRFVNSFL